MKAQAIYHITSAAEAKAAALAGFHVPAAFASEGFIHCSYPPQVSRVANRLFAGRTDLVLFEIDRACLTCEVVDENLEGWPERFPHIYGPLPMVAVAGVFEFPCTAQGQFELPHPLKTGILSP